MTKKLTVTMTKKKINNDNDDPEFRKTNESYKFHEKQFLLLMIYKLRGS